jgi:hypothetical protein
MGEMKEQKYIRELFKGLSFHEAIWQDYFEFQNITTGNFLPPAYIVKIIFIGVLKLGNYGKMEKVDWHTYFRYKDHVFLIRDFKFGSWTIACNKKNEDAKEIVKELKGKIPKAARVVDKLLYKELKPEVEKENFYLTNVYHKLSSLYSFYAEKIKETITDYEKFESKKEKLKSSPHIAKTLNTRVGFESTILNYSFSLILSFFSILEFILDVLYAFEQPSIKYTEYKKRYWNERFKIVFDIKSNKKIKLLFDEFIRIKEDYRNPLSHGLTNEVNLLVHLPNTGLIPLSYEYLSHTAHFSFFGIKEQDAKRLIETFSQFFDFLKQEKPYLYYMHFLEYSFPIPLASKEIAKIKSYMTSYEDFKEHLYVRAQYEDALTNRDI